MANPPTFPSDGRITSLQNYTAGFTGGELFAVVAPGNAAAGINYNVTAAQVATGIFGAVATGQVLASNQGFAAFTPSPAGLTSLTVGTVGLGTELNPQAQFVLGFNAVTGLAVPTNPISAWQIGATGQQPGWNQLAFQNNCSILMYRTDGIPSGQLAVQSGEIIGVLNWLGYNGATFVSGLRIAGAATETFGANHGAFLEFDTTPAGTSTRSQAMRIMGGVVVGAGTTDPGVGNLTGSGFHRAADSSALQSGGNQTVSYLISSVATFGIFCGTGVPLIAAGTGSLYLRNDGATATTRMYVNQNGSTTWTAVTTQA